MSRGAAVTGAVISAAGAIAAALITIHSTSGHSTSGPSRSPAPSPTYASGTIQVPKGYQFAYVYSIPTADLTTDRVGELSQGTAVKIICTIQGEAIGNGDTLWDEIAFNSGSAYISDIFVFTGTSQPVMPACR
jgi:hypothetical protein